ncbi:hypothetical protein E5329_08830 [Petralouisia muris]|jgi:hypothetical protein|uniref:Uncharacterized protein n=1 Tax=Petralouisia muris TaxID=3032872 RepID=A0AC61RY83_9FIRM|nr:hypothetical protein [Petralouisia muris]TGY96656.1 hypothetical protein E5329_08830 [Petralouisia muris]
MLGQALKVVMIYLETEPNNHREENSRSSDVIRIGKFKISYNPVDWRKFVYQLPNGRERTRVKNETPIVSALIPMNPSIFKAVEFH